jgi:hypothetical protein
MKFFYVKATVQLTTHSGETVEIEFDEGVSVGLVADLCEVTADGDVCRNFDVTGQQTMTICGPRVYKES